MHSRIGELHTRFRIMNQMSAANGRFGASLSHLERLMHSYFGTLWDSAMERTFSGDEHVYVVRQATVAMSLQASADGRDLELAQQWINEIVFATVRQIAREDEHGDSLRVYDSQAHYLASYLSDRVNGKAGEAWYYAPLEQDESISHLLTDNRANLAKTFALMTESGYLNKWLRSLDRSTTDELWQLVAAADLWTPFSVHFRPLFMHAYSLIKRLALWNGNVPSPEALFQRVWAEGAYLPDWSDPRSLATAVRISVARIMRAGYIRPLSLSEVGTLHRDIDQELKLLDFLDVTWLEPQVMELLASEHFSQSPVAASARLAPRYESLLHAILEFVRSGTFRLRTDTTSLSAETLRLYALLLTKHPAWENDPVALETIDKLVRIGAALARAPSPQAALQAILAGDIQRAISLTARVEQQMDRPDLELISVYGDLGVETLAALGELSPDDTHAPQVMETHNAGLFLLLRAVLDMRLATLAAALGLPSETAFPLLLLSLSMYFASPDSPHVQAMDPGILLLAGLQIPFEMEKLRAAWQLPDARGHARLQAALLNMARARRITQAQRIDVMPFAVDGHSAVVGVDRDTGFVMLGSSADDAQQLWIEQWYTLTGEYLDLGNAEANPAMLPIIPDTLAVALGGVAPAITTAVIGSLLLRVWAHWLRQFQTSSVPYLLEQFIWRKGRLFLSDEVLTVELERRPLDVVLDLAGYFHEIPAVPWLNGRSVRFRSQE